MAKVLIVDDATFMRMMIKDILEKNGFEVVGEANNGLKAVELYKKEQPDVVTMDITMPDMDGVQALKSIKKIDSNCKIVMVSAMGQETFVREAIISGAKGFVVKPIKEEHLVKTLNKL